MNQAIVKAETGQLTPGDWQALREQAKALVASGFLPKAVNTAEKAIAIALAGRELGLPTMQAIRSIHVIDGKPTMSADLMAALVHKRMPGAVLRVAESDNTHCLVEAARAGQEVTAYEFTLEDAKRAGLLGKDNWSKYPRAMLRARALSEAARATFPDALVGVYDPDELGAVTTPDGEVITTTGVTVTRVSPFGEPEAGHEYADPEGLYQSLLRAGQLVEMRDLSGARQLLGTRAQQGEIPKAIQAEHEAGNVSPDYHKQLSKEWARLDRLCVKLEKEQANDAG